MQEDCVVIYNIKESNSEIKEYKKKFPNMRMAIRFVRSIANSEIKNGMRVVGIPIIE